MKRQTHRNCELAIIIKQRKQTQELDLLIDSKELRNN
jgi:hypothetical protein